MADWYHPVLSEVYIQIIAGAAPLITILRNLPTILKVMLTAQSHLEALEARFSSNPHIDPRRPPCREC